MDIDIVRLNETHDCKPFKCGHHTLDHYLRRYAVLNDQADVSRAYVAVPRGQTRVAGYYTLSSGQIDADIAPDPGSPYPMPVALLGRLAVDRTFQGQGLGSLLLLDALRNTLHAASYVAIRALVVDALDENAKRFYEHFGFRELLDDPKHLYLPLSQAAALPLE